MVYKGLSEEMENKILVPIDYTDISREQDYELQRLQNILDSYVKEQNLQANFETFIRFGTPYVKILDMQKAHKPAMMMMAAHYHTAIGRMLMGSNTDYLVHHANFPMLIFKDKE